MGNYSEAGQGLKKMFIAQIGIIVCSVLMIIPIINIIAMIGSIVFMVISIVGLNQAGKEIEGCKTAFILTIVNLIVSIVGAFFKTGILYTLFSVATSVLSLLVAYYVCTSVAAVMNQIGAADVAAKGITVWKFNLVCYIILIVASVLALIPIINIIAGIVAIITSIVAIVAEILYMIFLNKSYHALGVQ